MTIRPSLCPLDKASKLGRLSDQERKHVHDACACFDQHQWASGMMNDPECVVCHQTRCGKILEVKRAGKTVGKARCDRASGHDSRHVANIYSDADRKRRRGNG